MAYPFYVNLVGGPAGFIIELCLAARATLDHYLRGFAPTAITAFNSRPEEGKSLPARSPEVCWAVLT